MFEKPRVFFVLSCLIVAYTAIVVGAYYSNALLNDRLAKLELENERLVEDKSSKRNDRLVPERNCENQPKEMEAGPPYLTMLLIFSGCGYISRFLYNEYCTFIRKKKVTSMQFTLSELLQYRLDYHFTNSEFAKPVLLLMVTFVLIVLGGFILLISTGEDISVTLWKSWTYVADPGTHADTEGTLERIIAFCVTIGGMLVFALMIGIISESIGEQVDNLRKGKSRVIECGHTLMLGWNDKSLPIIQQIAFANESEGGGVIVVLAEHDKNDLEDTLESAIESRENALNLMGTEVIFRSGNPLVQHDLLKVGVLSARSIIVLASDNISPDESDSRMVRQVLSLKGMENLAGHVVVEMQDVDNRELVNLVAVDIAEVIVAHDIIGRLMIQCARQPGLAYILESLMGFEGAEFYLENWPQLEGLQFSDIICRFDDAIPIGVKKSIDGRVLLNPQSILRIEKGDQIIVLAEDNDSYTVNDGTYKVKKNVSSVPQRLPMKTEKMLFCGWRRDMADMIMQLDAYVSSGSELWLFNTVPVEERVELLKDKGNKDELKCKNLVIKNAVGNPIIRRDLMVIKEVRVDRDGNSFYSGDEITVDQFDSLLILADHADQTNIQTSDSRSLASLLIIQDIQSKLLEKRKQELIAEGKIDEANSLRAKDPISEILDSRTRSLLSVVKCKGYVMSNQIVSAVIAQVAECRDLNMILSELLSAEGTELYLRQVEDYVDIKRSDKFSFWDLSVRVRERREVLLGFKSVNETFPECKTVLNPSDKGVPRKWQPGDLLVVLALD